MGGLVFNPMGFVDQLPRMGVGMLVIFVVIGAIILTTMLINWLFSEKYFTPGHRPRGRCPITLSLRRDFYA